VSDLKKTIKLVTKVLSKDKKRKLYSDEEIAYMERQLSQLKVEKERRKLRRKLEKGFGNESS
jgi:hypothetical protein